MHWSTRYVAVGGSILALALAGCGSSGPTGSDPPPEPGSSASGGSGLPRGSEPANLDPAQFTTRIDNPYWPLAPGSKWVYREVENGVVQRVEVTATDQTKVVDGVTARVVHDVVTTHGQPVEKTFDWYAQDSAGNVWYLGEDTQEYDKGNAEDRARVTNVDAKARVPFGSFDGVLQTKDVNPLETNFVESKYYAKGVGPIETIQVSGGTAHEQLISYRR